jgi:leader peptidase (prepilin peptidase)/N-methyltransferase
MAKIHTAQSRTDAHANISSKRESTPASARRMLFVLLWLVGMAGAWLFKEEAMGGGDIKMMAMVGSFVGWRGVLLTVFAGALLGSLIFVPLSLKKKRLVPFGVFLAVGAVVAFVFGGAIIAWYGHFLKGD